MTQQTIQVGATPNDGQGTPLRNSFIICNSNFTELYARAQVDPPVTLQGSLGDRAGWYAYDSQYFYYCFADYTDGVDDIWAQVSQVGNVSVSLINNGTSNVKIDDINGNATTSIANISNVIVVSTTGQYVTGVVSATGNIRGSYILGNGSQLTGLPATYTNSNVTALLSNFGSNSISSTGNVTSANVNGGSIYSTGNVNASQQISATGNITTSGYFLGSFIGNMVATISNLPGPSGAVIYNNGSGNAAGTTGLVFDNSGPNVLTVLGSYSATSNVVAGNVLTSGLISATGNITGDNVIGGNLYTAGVVSATGNVRGGNLNTVGLVTATGNVIGGNILTGGLISATGNITGGNLSIGSQINIGGNMSALGYTGTSVSVSGNVSSGNIRTGGLVSATGNVTGSYILGNGSQLTGLAATNVIQNGNSNVLVGTVGGNVSINVNGIAPLVLVTPLGQTTAGFISATGTVTAGNVDTGGTVSATGTIRGANVYTNGAISATGNISGGNLVMPAGSGNIISHDITSGGNVSVTGFVTANGNVTGANVLTNGNITVAGVVAINSGGAATAIINSASNGVGNIGSSTSTFNTVFAKATTAQYADLAENYVADADYAPGTVVVFGGEKEITVSNETADERVAGAISTQPAHLMNAGSPGLPVALRGQVPVNVVGPVTKGDSLVTSSTPGFAQSVGRDRSYAQAVFAKSLETNLEDGKKIIVAVIL
jgi:hypothetical protein